MIDLSIENRLEAFASMRDEWNCLLENSENKTVFLRWEWLYNWWMTYRTGSHELFICVARDKGKLIGVAPFFIKKSIGGVRIISFLGSNIVGSDYLDIISDLHYESEASCAILKFVQDQDHLWDVIELDSMLAKSSTVSLMENYHDRENIFEKNGGTVCPFISLKRPLNAVWTSYSTKLKNTIKRKLKKLHNHFNGQFITVPESDDIADYYEQFVRLNLLRFKEKKIYSPFSHDSFVRFHKSVLLDLHKKGMAKLLFLKINNRLIAGIYLLIYDNKYYYYQSGYDPAWRLLSPGTLLFDYSIKTAYENGCKEFDFLRGAEKYKYDWTKTVHEQVNLRIYRNTRKGMALLALHRMKKKAKKTFRGMLSGKEKA